ncbi:hypothetical protein HMPREF0493_0209 [Lactobacillus amylolyticus DSM 11664]|uniref:Uncharacterized protein n=1 Tax=Lactobacillus amylolyticus DSM 11664 TaxID=585524 RepID=D4YRT1_9LACO|nr:hypothetical protein HMPREF0493_0209 [Lactobacillus amylolyticus DSM 11664]
MKKQQDQRQIFYPIYSKEEIAANPEKADTGLYFFKGKKVHLLPLIMRAEAFIM